MLVDRDVRFSDHAAPLFALTLRMLRESLRRSAHSVCALFSELLAHCRRQLAAYKIPRLMKFVSEAELPLTVTGKLQKNRLAELFTRGT